MRVSHAAGYCGWALYAHDLSRWSRNAADIRFVAASLPPAAAAIAIAIGIVIATGPKLLMRSGPRRGSLHSKRLMAVVDERTSTGRGTGTGTGNSCQHLTQWTHQLLPPLTIPPPLPSLPSYVLPPAAVPGEEMINCAFGSFKGQFRGYSLCVCLCVVVTNWLTDDLARGWGKGHGRGRGRWEGFVEGLTVARRVKEATSSAAHKERHFKLNSHNKKYLYDFSHTHSHTLALTHTHSHIRWQLGNKSALSYLLKGLQHAKSARAARGMSRKGVEGGKGGRDLRKRHLLMGFASAPVDFPVSDCINGPSKLLPVTSSTSFFIIGLGLLDAPRRVRRFLWKRAGMGGEKVGGKNR